MGMWVDTRSDDGVGVAWQGLFFNCLMSLFRKNQYFDVFLKIVKIKKIGVKKKMDYFSKYLSLN